MRLRPQLRSPWRCLGSGFAAGIGGGAAENATEEEGDEATATVPDGREAGEETIPHLGSRSIWENCSSLQIQTSFGFALHHLSIAKIGFETAENEPRQIFCVIRAREP